MSTSQTPNYGLNQWSPEDQFLRKEFNADNARTDAALAALASSVGEKAAQADLTSLTAAVSGKADQTALDSLTATVNKKANQSDLTALTQTVNTKAAQSALNSLTATVNTKAAQSALNSLTTTVNTKANQSDLNALTATVNTKASQADLNAVSAANKWVKLCETTSWADAATFDVALPSQDYSRYNMLRLIFHCAATDRALCIRLNGVTTTTYYGTAISTFGTNERSNYLFYISNPNAGDFTGEGALLPHQGGGVTAAQLNITVTSKNWFCGGPSAGVAQIPFRDLRTLNFYVNAGVIKAGAWCVVYGLLK